MTYHPFNLPPGDRYIVLAVVLVLWLVIRGGQFFASRGKSPIPPGAPRDYGIWGGAVCPRCHRAIRLGAFPLKFGFGTRIVRCEFCGKISLVRRLSVEELRRAEAQELADTQPAGSAYEKSESEKLNNLIDQSKYTDRK